MADEAGTLYATATGFEWKIDNFFHFSENGNVYSYSSPFFSHYGESWYLAIDPNGMCYNDSLGYVNLHLVNESLNSPITVDFTLALKTSNGERYLEKGFTKTFKKGKAQHHAIQFISRSDLEGKKTDLVPSGVLTVVCTFKTSKSDGNASKSDIDINISALKKSHYKIDFIQK